MRFRDVNIRPRSSKHHPCAQCCVVPCVKPPHTNPIDPARAVLCLLRQTLTGVSSSSDKETVRLGSFRFGLAGAPHLTGGSAEILPHLHVDHMSGG